MYYYNCFLLFLHTCFLMWLLEHLQVYMGLVFPSDSSWEWKSRQVLPSQTCKWEVGPLLHLHPAQPEAQLPFQTRLSLNFSPIVEISLLSFGDVPRGKMRDALFFSLSSSLSSSRSGAMVPSVFCMALHLLWMQDEDLTHSDHPPCKLPSVVHTSCVFITTCGCSLPLGFIDEQPQLTDEHLLFMSKSWLRDDRSILDNSEQ